LIGYAQASETVAITAGGTATADFELRTSAVPLEAVIVSAATGREQRARELGASVAAIEVENLNPAPITSFADALGGRSSGVIMQDVNGTTGTSQRIRIRGANSLSLGNEPLVFVDGVQMDNDFGGTFGVGGQEPSRLNDINPNDIANIEVIKGPAASALYGTAAANGVILITTKRGQPGQTQWTAFAEYGELEDVTEYPTNWAGVDVLNPNAQKFTSAGFFNHASTSNPDGYGVYCSNRAAAVGDCTQDEVLSFNTLEDSRTTPFVTGTRERIGASVRGGTEQVRFFVSGQFEDEHGVIEMNSQDKANFRGNLDAELSETADLSVSFGYTDSNLALNNNDNSIFSPIINGLLGYPAFIPAAPESEWSVNPNNYGFGFNMEQLNFLPTVGEVDRYIASTNLRWRPTSWLTFNATGGLDLTSTHQEETLQPASPLGWLHYTYENGYRVSQRSTDYLYTATGSGVATFELTDDLVSTTTLGSQYTLDNAENTYCYGSSLVPGTASCGTTASDFSIDEDFFEIRTVGGYVSQELAFRDRMFLAAGIRADDNSAFGTDFELAYYPSASFSWVIAEEPWFPQLDFLNTLRLRTAWGVSGLRPGFRDAVTLFAPTTVATAAGDVAGVTLDVTGNEELKPERSEEFELGFETGLFDDRLSLEFTYFNKTSEDALIERRLPPSLGLTTEVFDNLGSIQNTGTELGVNLVVFESQEFALNVGFSNTTLSNEVLDIGADQGVEDIIINRGLQRHREGYTAGGFWQPEVTWDDVDGNGLLSDDEVTVGDSAVFIGPSLPEWQRSFFADARLFDWLTVSTLIEGRGGFYKGNDSEAFRCGYRSTRGCAAVGNPDAPLQEQAAYIADRYLGSAYGYVEKADFYKWRELSLTFSVPQAWTQYFQQAEGLRLTLAGRNLATWTDYDGLDPETNETGGNTAFHQSEFNTQPPVRYLMLRLDYTF
nr:SusC/RagA family TonB-linked outer membrane protein [Gammaproteobacteria bacterium]